MECEHQLKILEESKHSFSDKLKESGQYPIKTRKIDILQLNISRKCNLSCTHCHVEAGPDRTEMMSKEILQKCLDLLRALSISTLDITGGAPEMNPHLEWFLDQTSQKCSRIIVRSNLVILTDPKYKKFLDIFTRNRVEVCASLPHYLMEKSDRQRGCGSYLASIGILKELNQRGYGQEGSGLVLDLVHNPVGTFLPGSQQCLEKEFKKRLWDDHQIRFNTLFSITNMPLGRYLKYLLESENFNDYMTELSQAFNPCAAQNVMCKNTLSVAWDGTIYNCDFNQMLCLPACIGNHDNIMDLDPSQFPNNEISIHNHCFGCTAGSGSSCQGSTE